VPRRKARCLPAHARTTPPVGRRGGFLASALSQTPLATTTSAETRRRPVLPAALCPRAAWPPACGHGLTRSILVSAALPRSTSPAAPESGLLSLSVGVRVRTTRRPIGPSVLSLRVREQSVRVRVLGCDPVHAPGAAVLCCVPRGWVVRSAIGDTVRACAGGRVPDLLGALVRTDNHTMRAFFLSVPTPPATLPNTSKPQACALQSENRPRRTLHRPGGFRERGASDCSVAKRVCVCVWLDSGGALA